MDQNFMKEKKILPLVISMSLPMVISMAVNSLYNIVDSYFVAKIPRLSGSESDDCDCSGLWCRHECQSSLLSWCGR